MIAYVKMWTSMLHDDWFVSLSCLERGFFMQLILLAKEKGDSGGIFLRNFPLLSREVGCDEKTARKLLRKFLECGKLNYDITANGSLHVTINKYQYWQQLRVTKDSLKRDRVSGEISEKNPPITAQHSISQQSTTQSNNAGAADSKNLTHSKMLEKIIAQINLHFKKDCGFPISGKILNEAGGQKEYNAIGESCVAIRKASEFAKEGDFIGPIIAMLKIRGKWSDDEHRESKIISQEFYKSLEPPKAEGD